MPARSIRFDPFRSAALAEIASRRDMADVLHGLGFVTPTAVLVLVGGANGLEELVARRLATLFARALVPALERLDAIVIDGGTDAGVMGLMGRARARAKAGFPLLGIAAKGTVILPGQTSRTSEERALLEPNHSHFLLVPGEVWGDEAPWMSSTASELSRNVSSATLVAGGGRITRMDIMSSLAAGRATILLARSGGIADAVADSFRSGDIAGTGIDMDQAKLLRIVDLDEAEHALPNCLETLLGRPSPGRFQQT